MRKIIFSIVLCLLSSCSYANEVAVHIFGKDIYFPDECILYVKPSLRDNSLRYICFRSEGVKLKPLKEETWITIRKNDDEISKMRNHKNTVHKEDKVIGNLNYSIFSFFLSQNNKKLDKLHLICDLENCLSIHDSTTGLHEYILKQFDEMHNK